MSRLEWYDAIRYEYSFKKYARSKVEEVFQERTKMNKKKGGGRCS